MLEPRLECARGEDRGQLGRERVLRVRDEMTLREVGPAEQLAEADEELRFQGRDGEVPAVGGLVDPVRGEPARQEARQRVAADAVRDEPVRAVRHRDRQARAVAAALALEQRGEDLGHGRECPGGEIGRLDRRETGSGVLENARPAEVVEVVTGALRMWPVAAKARDRAVDDPLGHVVRADTEPLGHAGPKAFEDDVGPSAERAAQLRLGLQVAGDRFLAGVQSRVPRRREVPHRIALRRLQPDDAGTQPQQLARGVRAGQVPREIDDELPGERLQGRRRYHYGASALAERSSAQEEKRRLILAAAVRVFARKGYHTSRVGDIAEEAGVAHGLLYHYFSSKEEVLHTVFRENWSELLDTFRRIESSDEPPLQQLQGIAKVLLRTWRNDPDLVRVMVRDVARSRQLESQVDEIREGFLVIQRVIERGQADGTFRRELDARLASWIVYGGLEELLTGWVLGQLPDGDEDVARAEQTVIDVVCGGLAAVAPVRT